MNEHAVPAGSGGYIFAFSISRKWVRMAALCAVAAGAVTAIVASATETFRVPLGILLSVLALTMLTAYAVTASSPEETAAAPSAARRRRVVTGRQRGPKSLASDLALLADLHAQGALSTEEFTAAKRRILGS